MRLWHYDLVHVLPDKMLISQWRECIAIKRQWEKDTLKHPLVSYVKNYNKQYFLNYVYRVIEEMKKRNIRYQKKFSQEIRDFCFSDDFVSSSSVYKEHNDRYFIQCFYNLQEKADRGIISKEEWITIFEYVGDNYVI